MELYQVVIVLLCLSGFGMHCWRSGRRNGIAGAVEYYTNQDSQDTEES